MRDVLLIIEIFKQISLKSWVLLIGVSILPYFVTHMVLPSVGAFLLVSFYIVKDVLSYKTALSIISIIAILIGIFLYLWKPILLMSIGASFAIIHYGIRDKLPLAIALRNELIFIFSLIVVFLSLLIGIIMGKVAIISSSSDGYVAALAICIGGLAYTSYSFYKIYQSYKKFV